MRRETLLYADGTSGDLQAVRRRAGDGEITLSGNLQICDAPGSGLFLTPPYFAANDVVNAANAGIPITVGQTNGAPSA
jgi:hypothetical protein